MAKQDIVIGAANAKTGDTLFDAFTKTNANFTELYTLFLDNRVIVKQASDLAGTLDSTKEYFIDGIVDMGSQTIEVPSGGLTISGYNFEISSLTSTQPGYSMFTSPIGGSGNLVMRNVNITTSGTGSQVFDLAAFDSFRALEFLSVNFSFCSSLGSIDGFRQLFESGTGRIGGSPELTFVGSWNGARISTSIVRVIDNGTTLFKAGAGLTFSGRFITDINADLEATGALFDFSSSNIVNNESLIVDGAFVTRDGALDASDATIYPNINHESVKSKWKNNTGMPNTNKYINAEVTTEVLTTVTLANTYYPLLGTFTVNKEVQFNMPANGEFELLTGNGTYIFTGNIDIVGTANDVIDIRVTKSTDGGATYPIEINHISRQVNNLVGGRDIAFFPLNFISDIKQGERVRLEVENKTAARDVTAALGSYFIISEV